MVNFLLSDLCVLFVFFFVAVAELGSVCLVVFWIVVVLVSALVAKLSKNNISSSRSAN